MTEHPFAITLLNDFIFCPASVYFHSVDYNTEKMMYESREQLQGAAVHEPIDEARYSTKKDIVSGIDVYSEQHGFYGKIDLLDTETGELTERKLHISRLFDGQVFQLYAQYYCLTEMGYTVKKMRIHSIEDNKNYYIKMPSEDADMNSRFMHTVGQIQAFDLYNFVQNNYLKCRKCVYEPMCPFTAGETDADRC